MKRLFLFFLAFTIQFAIAQGTFSILFTNPSDEGPDAIFEDNMHNYIGVGSSADQETYIYTPKIWIIFNNGDTLTGSYPLADTSWAFLDIRQNTSGNYIVTGTIMWQPDYYTNLVVVELDHDFNIISRKITMLPGMETLYQWVMKKHLNSYYIIACTAGPSSTPSWVGDPYFIKLNENFDTICTYHTNLSGGQVICDVEFSADKGSFYIFTDSYFMGGTRGKMVVYDTSFIYKYYKNFSSNSYANQIQAKWKTDSTFLIGCNYVSSPSEYKHCLSEMDTMLSVEQEFMADSPDTVDMCGYYTNFDFRSEDSIFYTGIKNERVAFWPQTPSWVRIGMVNRNLQPYFERFYGGDASYRTLHILATSDGNALVCALRYDYLTQDLEHDVLFIKVNGEGLVTNIKNEFKIPLQPFSIYPNPGHDFLNLILVGSKGMLSVADLNGNILIEKEISEGEQKVDCRNLVSGGYLVIVTDSSGALYIQKWIKQ